VIQPGALRALHVPGSPLVLPNVWDVTLALAVAEAGYPALATSSEAVAGSLGDDDGQAVARGQPRAGSADPTDHLNGRNLSFEVVISRLAPYRRMVG
jgi:hypothetical protein